MIAGVLLGWLNPKLGADMKPFGDGFIALVRMIIGPVIFCTVVHGVAATNDFKRVGRVAIKALVYFEAVTLIALVIPTGYSFNLDGTCLYLATAAERSPTTGAGSAAWLRT